MERSEQINELAAALAIAQGGIENAKKESNNPYFKSKYADLGAIFDAFRKPFAENGLSILQIPSVEAKVVTLKTIIMHSSGQFFSADLTIPCKDETAQGIGSALTYARRYALQTMCGVGTDDDDGESAMGRDNKSVDEQKKPIDKSIEKPIDLFIDDNQMNAMFKMIDSKESKNKLIAIAKQYGYTEWKSIKKTDYLKICDDFAKVLEPAEPAEAVM